MNFTPDHENSGKVYLIGEEMMADNCLNLPHESFLGKYPVVGT
jgi:hypothetical protein